jgi:hypothetical protein
MCLSVSPNLNVRVCSLLCNTEIPFTYSVRTSWRDLFPTTSCCLRWMKVFLLQKLQFQTGHSVTCSLLGSFACQRIIEAAVCVERVALWGALVRLVTVVLICYAVTTLKTNWREVNPIRDHTGGAMFVAEWAKSHLKMCWTWSRGGYTGRFIMYSGITKIYYRKTVGHVFTKPIQMEGTIQYPPATSKLFLVVIHISAARRCERMCEKVVAH